MFVMDQWSGSILIRLGGRDPVMVDVCEAFGLFNRQTYMKA